MVCLYVLNQASHQLDELVSLGARSFLFLTVPPTDRAPLSLVQGPQAAVFMHTIVSQYNSELQTAIANFQTNNSGTVQDARVFDTQPVFNFLLDNADSIGYVNVTGFCEGYGGGIGDFGCDSQIEGCAPIASYL